MCLRSRRMICPRRWGRWSGRSSRRILCCGARGVVLAVRGAGPAPPDGAGVEAAYGELVRRADVAVVVLW